MFTAISFAGRVMESKVYRVTMRLILSSIPFLGLILAPPCLPQNLSSGDIRGTVVDSSGAPVSGVSVDALNIATGIHTHGTTGNTGVYDLPFVETGEYTVTFTKSDFDKFVQIGVVLHIASITVNATLKVGSVATEVSVTAAPPLLQTETSELSTVMTRESVSELPNVGRNRLADASLIPGSSPGKNGNNPSPVGSVYGGESIAINGGQSFQSSWLIDGAVATLPVGYNPDGLSPPLEAISEIDTTSGNFGAESGNGLAVFNVITKSGTNKFHGSLFEFNQNTLFNAAPRNWSTTPQAKPATHWNEFGGTIGGPILRNRLFFFLALQFNPTRGHVTGLYTYPTDDMRAGNFAGLPTIYNPATTAIVGDTYTRQPFPNNQLPYIDPVAAAMQKFLPEPNAVNASDPDYNNYYFSVPSEGQNNTYSYKVDGDISPHNHAYVSGMKYSTSGNSPAPDCPIDCYVSSGYELSGQLTDTWTLSPTNVNEFRVGVARSDQLWIAGSVGKGYPAMIGLPDLPGNTFPVLNVSSGPSISVGGSAVTATLESTSITVSDTFDWILGRHTVKLGGEYDNWTDNEGWQTINAGTFNFSGIATRDPNLDDSNPSPGVGYADFLLGAVNSWGVTVPIAYGNRSPNLQLFAQDYYKILPNLTVNFGMRYLYQVGWKEEHNRSSNYSPTLLNPATHTLGAIGFAGVQIPARMEASVSFFAPRVGFSFVPKPSWTVRGGFGLYAVPWSGNAYTNGSGIGWTAQGNEQSNDNLTPVFQLSSGPPPPVYPTAESRVPSLLNGQNITYNPYHTPISYFEQWMFGLQHQLGSYLLQANYVGTRGVKIYFGSDINQVLSSQLGSGQRPNPTYQQISASLYNGTSNYNALQVTAKRQFNGGISFLANYTWSKSLDSGTSGGGDNVGLDSWQNAYNPAANYAASSNDVRNTLNGTGLYQIPFGKGRKYANTSEIADALIGGWQVSTTFTYNSGSSFTPLMANNLSGALSGSWYPNRVGKITVPHRSVNEWFNIDAFTQPTPNTFGNSSRNILYGPHFADVDLSLAKSFAIHPLGDAGSFQLKVDSYDAFNHPNYGQPNSTIGGSGVGTISSSQTNRGLQLGGILRF
jgi:hypothetical protein